MNKDIAQIVISCLFGISMFMLFAGGDSSAPHACFAFGLLLIGMAIIQSFTGKIFPEFGDPIERDKAPARFWRSTAVLVALGIGCLGWAIPHLDHVWSLPHFLQLWVKL